MWCERPSQHLKSFRFRRAWISRYQRKGGEYHLVVFKSHYSHLSNHRILFEDRWDPPLLLLHAYRARTIPVTILTVTALLTFRSVLSFSPLYSPQGLVDNRNFWIRLFPRSITNIFPLVSKLRVWGICNWLDADPPPPEQPTKHRKPSGPDPTMRWLFWSTMKRYPSASRTTPVGPFSDMFPIDPAPATVVAFNSPDRKIWTLLFPKSAT